MEYVILLLIFFFPPKFVGTMLFLLMLFLYIYIIAMEDSTRNSRQRRGSLPWGRQNFSFHGITLPQRTKGISNIYMQWRKRSLGCCLCSASPSRKLHINILPLAWNDHT